MKPMICTSRSGSRSRSRPASSVPGLGGGREGEARRARRGCPWRAAPRRPAARARQTADGPAPRSAARWRRTASAARTRTNGTSTTIRLQRGSRAAPASSATTTASSSERRRQRPGTQSRGVATTSEHEAEQRDELEVRRAARWTGEWPWKCSWWPCPAPTSGAAVRRRSASGRPSSAAPRRRTTQDRPPASTRTSDAADDAGDAAGEPGVVDALGARSRRAGSPSVACCSAVSAKPLSSATCSRPSGWLEA